jgi:hypothetical protein
MKMQVVGGRVVVAMLLLAAGACGAGGTESKEFAASFRVSDAVTAEDVGLPTYPGSKLHKNAEDSGSAANLGLSTPMFGFKVVAIELESDDRPEKVGAFYRRALAKYGNVLECRDTQDAAAKSDSSDELTCDAGDGKSHSVVYKVGTKNNQRIVAITPQGKGTQFDLVHVHVRE